MCLNAVVARILTTPECARDVYSLSPGPHYDGVPAPEGSESGAIDVARLMSIMMNNSFSTASGVPGDNTVNRNRWDTQTGSVLHFKPFVRSCELGAGAQVAGP